MIGLAFKNILKRKIRSIMTILGVLVAMQLYLVLTSIMNMYDGDMQKQISSFAGRIMVQGRTETGNGSFYPLDSLIKQSIGKDIISSKDVNPQSSVMVLFQSLVASSAPGMAPQVMVAGIEPGKEVAYIGKSDTSSGSKFLKGDHEIILGITTASYYQTSQHAKLGDFITIRKEKFKIVGILPEITSVIDRSVIMPLATAQDIFSRPDLVSAIMVTAQKTDNVDSIAKSIETKYPKLMAPTSKEMQKSADNMLAELRKFFSMISNTIIVVAICIIMIVMNMAVNERKKELGTLKAIGASGRKIMGMIIIESLTLSLIGGIIALPVSIGFAGIIIQEFVFNIVMWAQTLVIAVLLGVVAGLWPAWSAQRVNPLESLRYE